MERLVVGFLGGAAAALWALVALLTRDGRRRQQEEATLVADLERLKTRLRTADEERRAA